MLDILLTEVRIRRLRTAQNSFWSAKEGALGGRTTHLDDIEQFRHDSGHTSKKGWSAASFHLLPITLDLYKCALLLRDVLVDPRGVHVLYGGHEHGRRCARCTRSVGWLVLEPGEEVEVMRKSTRVCCEIFVRRELRWIDEDGHYGQLVLRERAPH